MTRRGITAWMAVHRWTGLISTAFLLMLCVTGLPLIFHAEIDDWWSPPAPLALAPAGTPLLPLDALLGRALAAHPGEVPLYLSFDEDRPVVNVTSAPSPDAGVATMHFQSLDRRTGAALAPRATAVTDWLLRLHTDLLLGLKGELFLGAMGLVFVAAIVSGVVLYVPFMARLAFGTVRLERGPRVRRLDRHNVLGALTIAWATVVALTGTLNTLAVPMTQAWQRGALATLSAGEGTGGAPARLATSVDAALASAMAAAPGMRPQFIAFPGAPYAGRRHLGLYLQGATPLTRRLLTPAFVEAESGRLDAVGAMPWYMQALLLAQPLHFGDYAGWPLKLLWTALDLLTIAVLWTGLRLWLDRGRSARAERTTSAPASSRRTRRRRGLATLGWPGVAAALTLAGLVVALIGDGVLDLAGALALAIPVLAAGAALVGRLPARL